MSIVETLNAKSMLHVRVAVAQDIALGVEQLLQRHIWRERANVHLEVEGDVLPAVVKWDDGAANLVEPCGKVFQLPTPEDAVEIGVMHEEERI